MTINEHQKGMLSMSNDILTKYTEEQNRNEGRRGYYAWKNKKETNIPPNKYGMFLEKHKKRGKRK